MVSGICLGEVAEGLRIDLFHWAEIGCLVWKNFSHAPHKYGSFTAMGLHKFTLGGLASCLSKAGHQPGLFWIATRCEHCAGAFGVLDAAITLTLC